MTHIEYDRLQVWRCHEARFQTKSERESELLNVRRERKKLNTRPRRHDQYMTSRIVGLP
jgi:hypothetical protein